MNKTYLTQAIKEANAEWIPSGSSMKEALHMVGVIFGVVIIAAAIGLSAAFAASAMNFETDVPRGVMWLVLVVIESCFVGYLFRIRKEYKQIKMRNE